MKKKTNASSIFFNLRIYDSLSLIPSYSTTIPLNNERRAELESRLPLSDSTVYFDR